MQFEIDIRVYYTERKNVNQSMRWEVTLDKVRKL